MLTRKGALAVVILSLGVAAGLTLAKQQGHRLQAEGATGFAGAVGDFLSVI
jgi:hypothetical protein